MGCLSWQRDVVRLVLILILVHKDPVLGRASAMSRNINRYLRDLIISGKAKPSFVVSHDIHIDDASAAYEKFDKTIEGYTKVLIHPNGPL